MRWNLTWRRRLFAWEETLVDELVESLQHVVLSDQVDKWSWAHDSTGDFSVKSTYVLVSDLLADRVDSSGEKIAAFKSLWKCPAPSKVLGFGWLLLLDRIPTKTNLFRRRILNQVDDQVCVLCNDSEENAVHLFLYCPFALRVWDQICFWLRLDFNLPHSCISLLNFFAAAFVSKLIRQGLVLIWSSVIWALWRQRNRIIFENGNSDFNSVVDEI
jgi:hypothetical protein